MTSSLKKAGETECVRLIEILEPLARDGDKSPVGTLERILAERGPVAPVVVLPPRPRLVDEVTEHDPACPAHAEDVVIDWRFVPIKLMLATFLCAIVWAIGNVAGFGVFLAINVLASLLDECLILYYKYRTRP